jgi:cytochrome c oxidase cbb3-type subunit I/II
VLSLSAFKDPLTGEPLKLSPEAQAALDDPGLPASSSEHAYVPPGVDAVEQTTYGGDAWAKRNGMDHVEAESPGLMPAAAAEN